MPASSYAVPVIESLNVRSGGGTDRAGVGGEVGQLQHRLRVARRDGGDGLHARHAVGRAEVPLREVHARHDHRRRAVGRRADVEQAQRIGDDRAVEHVLDRVLLAEARVRVLEPVLRVLHLHAGEVVGGRAVHVHAPARVEREVHRVRRAEQVEAQPVGVGLALAADGSEEALRRGVGADHQHDVGEARRGSARVPGGAPARPTRTRRSSTTRARRSSRASARTSRRR